LAKIGITLNEVLRDFIGQLAYTYEKYIGPFDLNEADIETFNLIDYFKFNSIDEMNKFIYDEAALEIFGHADQLHENTITMFNEFIMDIEDDEEHEIEIVSREVMKSIPATLFFLSKLSCKPTKIRFVKNYEECWDGVDVLITANPTILETKPKNKVAVKINATYNKTHESDYTLNTILDMISDEDLKDEILNKKTTTH
jgi:hypothetical protein